MARNRLARLNADGSLDGDFDPLGANGTVTSLAVQEDGGILLGGYFSSVAGVPAPLVARLKADGTANTAFHPTVRPSLNVRTLAQQPDDQKLLVAGDFATVGTTAGSSITRLNPDGSLDPSFRPDATLAAGSSPAAVVRPDREILAIFNLTIFNLTITDSSTTGKTPSRNTSGLSAPAAGEGRTRAVSAPIKNPLPPAAGDSFIPEVLVALLHADGSIDTGFRQPAVPYNGQGSALVLQTDGKFLVGGAFGVTKQVSNSLGANLVRFNADGSLDSGFVPGFGANSSEVDAIGVQPADGKIVVGVAYAGVANASVVSQIVRLLPDGSLDASFTAGIAERGTINTVVIQPDGKILLGGGFPIFQSRTRPALARVSSDGSPDLSFVPGAIATAGGTPPVVYSLQVQADAKILVAGVFDSSGCRAPQPGPVELGRQPGHDVRPRDGHGRGGPLPVAATGRQPDHRRRFQHGEWRGRGRRGATAARSSDPWLDGLVSAMSAVLATRSQRMRGR